MFCGVVTMVEAGAAAAAVVFVVSVPLAVLSLFLLLLQAVNTSTARSNKAGTSFGKCIVSLFKMNKCGIGKEKYKG